MIHQTYAVLKAKQNALITRSNTVDETLYNGIYDRFIHPVLTKDHVPIEWRYDLSATSNPFFMERLMVNAVFNPGAIYFEGRHHLAVRVEGADRKSFFAMASSQSGIDQFRFDRIIDFDDIDPDETNRYDMRLVSHEDGHIYGIFCSEKKDLTQDDTTSAVATVGLVRTKDLVHWDRLPNVRTKSGQQRNVVLHPEFVDGCYGFYTRPQDGFIDVGNAGGIHFGLARDINNAVINDEVLIAEKRYHTVYEYKNGQGPAPIKTPKGWIHIAHGVRQTAAGLRYVIYAFATSLDDLTKVIRRPSGYLIAPFKGERIGDVSNVLFTNGLTEHNGTILIYYASSDSRIHVARTTIPKLMDYVFEGPEEVYRSHDATKQRAQLIQKNTMTKENNDGNNHR